MGAHAGLQVSDELSTTPLAYAACSSEDLNLMQMLIDGGADSDHIDTSGRTSLTYAALEPDLAMAQMLVDRGADPSRADNKGQTPLTHAALTSTWKKAQMHINGVSNPDNLHRTHAELESNVKAAQTTARIHLHMRRNAPWISESASIIALFDG